MATDVDEVEDGVEVGECGHQLVRGELDGRPVLEHHEVPDDGAPHVLTEACGCLPDLLNEETDEPLYVHNAQEEMGWGDAYDD